MPELIVGISPFNIPRIPALLHGTNWYAGLAHEVGADGYLWSQIPNVSPDNWVRGGMGVALAEQGHVVADHQSWRTNRLHDLPRLTWDQLTDGSKPLTARAIGAVATPLLEGALVVGLPHLEDSLAKLEPNT